MGQTIDIGLGRNGLESYLAEIGYWGDANLRSRNAYVLSPSAYAVSPRQRRDLERLSRATYAAVENLSAELTRIATSRSIQNRDARFLSLATSSTKGLAHPKDAGGSVPPVLKVDLVQNAEGRYFVAEVDAYNPRGFGYLLFLDGTVPHEYRLGGRGMGVSGLAELLRRSGSEYYGDWQLIVSEFERYYEPSFRILTSFLREHGIQVRLVQESETAAWDIKTRNVFCIPESMHQAAKARESLVRQWMAGYANLFYPPTAYLGSKAFLPYLRTQRGMDEFVPECSLINKKNDPLATVNGAPVVLKGVMSSGLKKVVFRDMEPDRFASEYANARKTKNPQWLLQAQVPQEPTPIVVFDDEGNRIARDYYLRITAYVTKEGLLGAEVTGRTDRAVHGAPDCIQIPAVYI